MKIGDMQRQAHETAAEKGWHDRPGHSPNVSPFAIRNCRRLSKHGRRGGEWRGEAETGLADVVIRIGDICGRQGMNLEDAVRRRMEANRARPYRHGGKRA